MAKTIVFFNLADMHTHGLAKTSVQALQRKYQRYSFVYELFAGSNQIYQIDLFGLLKKQRDPILRDVRPSGVPQIPINLLSGHTAYLPSIERERLAISMFCGRADKIMLGVHGKFDDTTQGVAGLGWDQGSAVIGDYKEFAQLISSFLMPRKSYKLSLIVCFGARSQNYRVNHDGDLAEEDIKSSFAYKFFKEICTKADVTLTARTGSVAFDSKADVTLTANRSIACPI